ncbi:MAG: glycosyl hydrolase 53 family protein [Truepera sp.]|nr:glycosyl hydrolase 53 family protein [Truepera sp.]
MARAAVHGPVAVSPDGFIIGADISTLRKVEDHGGRFFDKDGLERDLIATLRDHGVNYIRLKIWKDPVDVGGYNDLPEVVEVAKRATELGLPVLLNFHYSNFWADPGRQNKPTAWKDLSFEELTQAVYAYTAKVITTLRKAGALPSMVQIGNEIQAGMLWPDGKTWGEELGVDHGGFDNLVALLRAGIDGVRNSLEPGDEVKIMLHLADGGDNNLYRWWFDEVIGRGLTDFDVIGVSFYPFWHGSLADLQRNLNDISQRYGKYVIVVETAYAFTLEDGDGHPNIFGSREEAAGGYPATIEGQAAFLRELTRVVCSVPDGRGLGIFYWEPAWLPVQGAGWRDGEGNAWENMALFDFDGNALPSLAAFKSPCALD